MGALIRDDFVEKSKTKKDFVEKEGGDSFGGNRFLGRAKNYPLSKPMVYHDHERIEARGGREIRDKVTRDLLEGARGDGLDGGEGRHGGVRVNLILLAKGAALDISVDERSKAGPPNSAATSCQVFKKPGCPAES